jgi:hypothetical protein
MAEGIEDTPRPLTSLFDRRRVLKVVAGSAAGTIGASSLIEALAGPAAANTNAPSPFAGMFDGTTRGFFREYTAQRWAAMRRHLDPNVLLTVMGSFRPGTYPGPDGVVGYFQSAFQAGFTVALQSVAGFQDYSLAVYQCTDPTGGTHQSGLAFSYTPAGLAREISLPGFT